MYPCGLMLDSGAYISKLPQSMWNCLSPMMKKESKVNDSSQEMGITAVRGHEISVGHLADIPVEVGQLQSNYFG